MRAGQLPIDEQLERFRAALTSNRTLTEVLARAATMGLPGWYLAAGCLYQTVWNVVTGQPPEAGILDYDLAYFDGSDLSWDAEDAVIQAGQKTFAGLPAPVQIHRHLRSHHCLPRRPPATQRAVADLRPARAGRRVQPRRPPQPGACAPPRLPGQDHAVASAMASPSCPGRSGPHRYAEASGRSRSRQLRELRGGDPESGRPCPGTPVMVNLYRFISDRRRRSSAANALTPER